MQWDSYPSKEYNGIFYGMKSDSFKPYWELPGKVGPIFELAIGGSNTPFELFKKKGWRLCNPLEVTKDTWTYEEFIKKSKAEFGVAKHGYVASNSGWFSERSACYLVSGRPVVVQDTGFSQNIPCGRGLLAFKKMDEAIAAIEEINGNYEQHCRWAREIAEEYFDYKKILPNLLENSLNTNKLFHANK